ncbi:MAG: hypothetical protein WC718_14895 [Phycisphaerales bacterium]|jgi:hypothetical protein
MTTPLKFRVTESTFELYPADVYDAKLTKIEQKQVEFNGAPNDVLEWTFTFLDGEYVGKTINDIASWPQNGLSPKSKIRLWIEGLLGRSLQGYTGEVDINKLVGKDCRINVTRGPNTKGREVNKIANILPPKGANKAAPTPAPMPVTPTQETEGELF